MPVDDDEKIVVRNRIENYEIKTSIQTCNFDQRNSFARLNRVNAKPVFAKSHENVFALTRDAN